MNTYQRLKVKLEEMTKCRDSILSDMKVVVLGDINASEKMKWRYKEYFTFQDDIEFSVLYGRRNDN